MTRLLAMGANEYLVKPFDIRHLGDLVADLIASTGAHDGSGALEAIVATQR